MQGQGRIKSRAAVATAGVAAVSYARQLRDARSTPQFFAARGETLLAFVFGFVFCGILAYAGLRSQPITDPGQFFFLRVLAALSAAGVAAVIPGMLDIHIGRGRLFAVRGAGALGVFVIVFFVNPPELVSKATDAKRAQ